MSIRRLIVEIDTSVVNVTEFCRGHQISTNRFYAIRRLYAEIGDEALEQRSRAPHRVANKTKADVEDRIVALRKQLTDEGLDAGPATIQWHLGQQGVVSPPSQATIWRILRSRGFITPDPKKRPKTPRRFQADRANEVWQIDGTWFDLADGSRVKIINIVDDCSRLNIASRVHSGETIEAARDAFNSGASQWGLPERFLSDNGTSFRALEAHAEALGVGFGHSRPYHPQTCGKVERFHQTQKKWIDKQDPAPKTIKQLQTLVDRFAPIYNTERAHRSLGRRTPTEVWNNTPKSGPTNQPLQATAPTEIGSNTVTKRGLLRAFAKDFAVGARYHGQEAFVTLTGTRIRIFINGARIRELDIKPDQRDYPMHPRRGRPPKQ